MHPPARGHAPVPGKDIARHGDLDVPNQTARRRIFMHETRTLGVIGEDPKVAAPQRRGVSETWPAGNRQPDKPAPATPPES